MLVSPRLSGCGGRSTLMRHLIGRCRSRLPHPRYPRRTRLQALRDGRTCRDWRIRHLNPKRSWRSKRSKPMSSRHRMREPSPNLQKFAAPTAETDDSHALRCKPRSYLLRHRGVGWKHLSRNSIIITTIRTPGSSAHWRRSDGREPSENCARKRAALI